MLNHLTTEQQNPASLAIDSCSSREIVELMNREDAQVAAAVATQSIAIAAAVDVIVDRLRRRGRLMYLGAGTSGRLEVLDASECLADLQYAAGTGAWGSLRVAPTPDAIHRKARKIMRTAQCRICKAMRCPREADASVPPRAHALRHGRHGLRPAYRCRHDRLEL